MKRHNSKRPWVTFFSQTGTEIRNLAKDLDYWPDLIITNERPEDLRTINPKLIKEYPGKIIQVSNRPTDEELRSVLYGYYNPIITLHGWLRIMSPWMCENYDIYNGHPGLITVYPELKGKDPQMRAFMGNYEWIVGDNGNKHRDTLMTFITAKALNDLVTFNTEALGLASVYKPELVK